MKKIFTLASFLVITCASQAQTKMIEDFSYTTGDPLTSNNWTQIGTTATNPISVTTPGLTYAGYAGSGVGNAATLTTSGQDIYRDVIVSPSSGSVYVSFMLNVATAQATGDYFFALLPTSSTTNFTARTFIKSSGAGYVLGVAKSTEAVGYGSTVLNFGTTYLVVVKYTFNAATTTDDAISLYVFASGVPATEPGTTEAGPQVGVATDATSLGRVALRQGSATSAAGLTIDGIRFGTSWETSILPLNLLSFSAVLSDNKVNVNWATANELNVAGYEIQRSVNGKDFMPITLIQAENSGSTKQYSYTDPRAVAGTSFYRLKMTDKDGSYKYSLIATIKNSIVGVSLYPNPVRSNVTIQHESADKGATVSIVGMSGKQLVSVNVLPGAVQTTIDAAKLSPGIYMVVYTNNGQKQTKQFVKE